MAEKKMVYAFGGDRTDGGAGLRDLLGGKGANLAEMASLGIPVPPGFTITTEMCLEYLKSKAMPAGLWDEVKRQMARLEKAMGAQFGGGENPLLVSVRSGARASMPGMMDTILNLGTNDKTVETLAKKTGNRRFAYDSFRRFINMFGNVVLGMKHHDFEERMNALKERRKAKTDLDLTADDMAQLAKDYEALVKEKTGRGFPQDPYEQLQLAVEAVFKSWNNERAITYRRLYNIPHTWGTAVNVQCMVFGNMGDDCGTGVAFSRNPATGEKALYGEILFNAQGEDVVAGIRTPEPIATLKDRMPKCFEEFVAIARRLEEHYKDMQDMEFTIQNGRLFMLQTRNGKRTAPAAVRIAVELVKEGLLDKRGALKKVDADSLDQLLHPSIDPAQKLNVIAKGLGASPGAAVGKVVFTAEDAVKRSAAGDAVVLVRNETSPEDIKGMNAARGILTARGGLTSHAAVVARQMGKCCVTGCGELDVRTAQRVVRARGLEIKEGDWISLNGTTGEVILGQAKLKAPELAGNFATLMSWADEVRTLGVRANADTVKDSEAAVKYGCEGIGLCRTEHMFFEGDRIDSVRAMILAENEEGRRKALARLLPMQREDFLGIFGVMKDRPVTIRLLDPPLHEFLPKTEQDMRQVSKLLGVSAEAVAHAAEVLKEQNPMLGHRGCRLAVTFPEISEMQARAIIEAACEMKKKGVNVFPEIMIPLTAGVAEWEYNRRLVQETAEKVIQEKGVQVRYLIGTMIEIPRACLVAGQIAETAEFFSFGTNDLTQLTYGLSRDDAGRFLPEYIEKNLIPRDPFVAIDREGVGEMVRIGLERGRKSRSGLEIGICGEHGGEPSSVEFCHLVKMDYVSCAPYRAPIARLAAAQAAIDHGAYQRVEVH
ncbi:MAG: pyruvate, phosphate dikinase [Candidatus Tectomicrobia bacterium]|uniref:Pyruvate, phosphate dikinase n=1 Tax=Tectimicrobiota bacterium TaxID=2528274 RepID=A0A932I0L0_UNCTE|nr:pyruvate, phosphate dikinase [Candidatus Tectomicrobia bacterium]